MVEVTVWSLGWFGKLDSKPVKMWDENGSGFWPVGDCPSTIKTCSKGHCLTSGLWDLHSQAKKLFRSGLVIIGPDWLNMTLRTGLVLGSRPWKHSQALKLFRSDLIVVGPDWLNMTLCVDLVVQPCVDMVLLDFPMGSWHCWLLPWWISSQLLLYLEKQRKNLWQWKTPSAIAVLNRMQKDRIYSNRRHPQPLHTLENKDRIYGNQRLLWLLSYLGEQWFESMAAKDTLG